MLKRIWILSLPLLGGLLLSGLAHATDSDSPPPPPPAPYDEAPVVDGDWTWDMSTRSWAKTRHDTGKNTISNVR